MSRRGGEFYSPAPKIMLFAFLSGMVLCLIFSVLFRTLRQNWMLTFAIISGMTAYHLLVRFTSPVILRGVFHKKYNCGSWWFRQKRWEPAFYQQLHVKKWKNRVMTYDPSEFSLKVHSPAEIVNNMCHAELVHELIVLLCFTSLLFAIPFGAFSAFLITAILSAAFDMLFVIVQRYNRSRVEYLIKQEK